MHKKNGCFLGKIVLHNYDVQKLKKFKRSNVSIFKLFRKKHRRGNIGLILINKRGHVCVQFLHGTSMITESFLLKVWKSIT